jgi:DNA-binding LytR/AlgR family response regulator
MELKIAILEDNNADYNHLISLLKKWGSETANNISIIKFKNEDIVSHVTNENYDIIFSDIELKNSSQYTGIQICEKLRKSGYNNEIIFTTAFKEYVFEGYNVQAFNYLIKPITFESLASCMKRYITIHEKSYYCLQDRSTLIQIRYNDIFYIEKQGHHVLFHTSTNTYFERSTLQNISKKLPNYFKFCHKSCVINLNHVHSVAGNEIFLSNNEVLNIGRTYLAEIRNALFDLSNL